MLRSDIERAERIARGNKVLELLPVEEVPGKDGAIERKVTSPYRWGVAMAWVGRERKAIDDLFNAGFVPYSPIGSKMVFHTYGRSTGLERQVRAIIPKRPFGPYLFVGQDKRLLGRSVSKHLVSVVDDQNGPLKLSADAIRAIVEEEIAGKWEWDRPDKAKLSTGFKVGQAVKITRGPFADFAGIVAGLEGRLRYKIEASLFGRTTPISLEACEIEAR